MVEIKEDMNQSGEGMPVIQLGLINFLAFSLDQITKTSCDKRIFGCIKVLIYKKDIIHKYWNKIIVRI